MLRHRHLTRGAFFIPIFKEETMRRLKDLFYSRDKPKIIWTKSTIKKSANPGVPAGIG